VLKHVITYFETGDEDIRNATVDIVLFWMQITNVNVTKMLFCLKEFENLI
jgi:hypothetical protein